MAVLQPDHPHARKDGRVLEHRLVMEKKLGRYLKSSEIVHHKDKNRQNNYDSNLKITCRKLHQRTHHIKYTKEGLIDVLKDCVLKGIRPTATLFRNSSQYPDPSIYQYTFGSWNNALNLAGIAFTRVKSTI